MESTTIRRIATRETALLTGLVFLGLVVLPIATYAVGSKIFGSYGGAGFGDFYRTLGGKLRGGDLTAWFLAFAPYVFLQILRLTAYGWRTAGRLN